MMRMPHNRHLQGQGKVHLQAPTKLGKDVGKFHGFITGLARNPQLLSLNFKSWDKIPSIVIERVSVIVRDFAVWTPEQQGLVEGHEDIRINMRHVVLSKLNDRWRTFKRGLK